MCTSAGPHGFKAKRVCGQLYSHQHPESLRPLLGTALKVMSIPSANQFTFLSPNKSLKPATLAEVSAQLATGQLQLFFGYGNHLRFAWSCARLHHPSKADLQQALICNSYKHAVCGMLLLAAMQADLDCR